LSILTTTAFCDPLFWRAEWRALSGAGNPNRCEYCDRDNEYPCGFQYFALYLHGTPITRIHLVCFARGS